MKLLHIGFLSLMISGAASAETVTLEQCVKAAVDNNPAIGAAAVGVERSRVLKGSSFDAPATEIELSQDATEGGGMDNGVSFTQEMEFPTVYAARRKALDADCALARLRLRDETNRLASAVTEAYYSLVYICGKERLLRERMPMYREFARIAGERLEAGETGRLEAVNAERLRDKAALGLKEIQGEKENARIILSSLTGLGEDLTPAEDSLPVLDLPGTTSGLSPDLTVRGQLLQQEILLGERNLDLARQEFLPSLFAGVTAQLFIKGFNPYHVDRERFGKGDFMGFRVGVKVPLIFGARRSRYNAAKLDIELARLKMERESLLMARENEEALNELARARDILDYYEKTGLPQASEIVRLAKVSYGLGEIGYVEYMRHLETAAEIQDGYLETVNRHNKAVIKLKTLREML